MLVGTDARLLHLARVTRHAMAGSLVLVLASCGSAGDLSTKSVLGRNFSAKVVAVCRTVLAEKKAEPPFPLRAFNPTKPDRSKLPVVGRYELRGVRIFKAWVQHMNALGQPPRGRAAWRDLLSAINGHARIIADQEAAAMGADTASFTRDFFAGNKVQRRMVAAADAAGVPVCATAAGA
jgi:hypothetical protein